ncbi:hypothetical protein KIH39_17920 [Telmatocola sphagniphila]|uniref:Uncharacterized protein n=1 Tax=Telmatocola sphagniphila TaxID=1123043 RepID=A0A8E6B263_9BACT|nr:hypothetical protein [Telmatocola sphagniphila]QVL30720.1 hypothetical protein KIH39_17920 [Telmatocola sphagniphila]
MLKLARNRPRFSRGLCAAACGAIGTVALAALLWSGYLVIRWATIGASEFDRGYDLQEFREYFPFVALACSTLGACSGWAVYAPVRRSNLARTLIWIFGGSGAVWGVTGFLGLIPRRSKDESFDAFHLVEVLLVILPPIALAILLTVWRTRQSSSQTNEELQCNSGAPRE